jgi:hypothetical protein
MGGLAMVIVTPGRTAPEASLTRPLIVPVVAVTDCAADELQVSARIPRPTRALRIAGIPPSGDGTRGTNQTTTAEHAE